MKQSQWHIVYTRPQREKKVAELFNRKKLKNYCPLNKIQIKYSNKTKIITEPLFTSYVFVHLNEEEKSAVLQTPGVLGFVYWLNQPAIIKNEEIAAINFFLQDYPQVIVENIAVNTDEAVCIINEPLMVRKGNVMEVTNHDSKVMLPSLGYSLVADSQKENSERFIYREESRVRV